MVIGHVQWYISSFYEVSVLDPIHTCKWNNNNTVAADVQDVLLVGQWPQ